MSCFFFAATVATDLPMLCKFKFDSYGHITPAGVLALQVSLPRETRDQELNLVESIW